MQTTQESKSIYDFNSLEAAIKQIKQTIKEKISIVTKISSNKIKEEDTFKSIGIDSLMALQSKNMVQSSFSISLNISSIWSNPTVEKFANFIASELQLAEKYNNKTSRDVVNTDNTIENEIKNLSLEELMKELSSKVD